MVHRWAGSESPGYRWCLGPHIDLNWPRSGAVAFYITQPVHTLSIKLKSRSFSSKKKKRSSTVSLVLHEKQLVLIQVADKNAESDSDLYSTHDSPPGAVCIGLTCITLHNYPAKNRPDHIVSHSTFPPIVHCKYFVGILKWLASTEIPTILGSVTQTIKHMELVWYNSLSILNEILY